MEVLIVSPFYPPYASVGVVRMASLSRYLTNKGVKVTVLRNDMKHMDKKAKTTAVPENIRIIDVEASNHTSYMKRFVQSSKAYKNKIKQVLMEHRYDVVIISGGPFYTLPLCKLVKKKYHTKCILDFRDLWIFETHGGKDLRNIKTLISKFLLYPVERTAIKYADKVVTVTEGWRKKLMKFYPKYQSKMEIIYNGYDDILLDSIEKDEGHHQQDQILLGAYGKLSYYAPHYAKELFKAVNMLKDHYKNLKIFHVGIMEEQTKNIISELQFPTDYFNCTGFCDYSDGIKMMAKSRICILVDVRKEALGTKIYDYIYLNKPIIYIGAKDTVLEKMVSSFENGFVCESADEIIEKIKFILENNITSLCKDHGEKQFARSIQNEKYLSMIHQIG